MVHLDKTDVDKGTRDTSHEACDHRNPGPVITRPVKGRNYQLERAVTIRQNGKKMSLMMPVIRSPRPGEKVFFFPVDEAPQFP